MAPHLTVWALRAALACLGLLVALALYVGTRTFRSEWHVFDKQRRAIARPQAAPAELLNVSFTTRQGVQIRGWTLPSRNGARIVLCHGSGSDRSELLAEALALHTRGFGVLLYDSPGHGESGGEVHWGEGEYQALEAALSQAEQAADSAPLRLGLFGHSMGGYVAALVAARDPRVRALVLAATPSHLGEHLRWEYRRWGPVSYAPAILAVRLRGLPLDGPMPVDVIGKLAPRPLLLITGSEDNHVPRHMTEALLAAARPPRQLLVLPGAGHGGYAQQVGKPYLDQLSDFFERSLGSPEQ